MLIHLFFEFEEDLESSAVTAPSWTWSSSADETSSLLFVSDPDPSETASISVDISEKSRPYFVFVGTVPLALEPAALRSRSFDDVDGSSAWGSATIVEPGSTMMLAFL